jgi:hypothetical protein
VANVDLPIPESFGLVKIRLKRFSEDKRTSLFTLNVDGGEKKKFSRKGTVIYRLENSPHKFVCLRHLQQMAPPRFANLTLCRFAILPSNQKYF